MSDPTPTNSNVRLGDKSLVFGVPDQAWGYVRNWKTDQEPEIKEARNGQNQTVAVEMTNCQQVSGSGSFYYKKNATGGPATIVGTDTGITITDTETGESGTYYVTKVTKTRSQDDWMIIDFEATYWPHLVESSDSASA